MEIAGGTKDFFGDGQTPPTDSTKARGNEVEEPAEERYHSEQ
jgi:hypothetical protein